MAFVQHTWSNVVGYGMSAVANGLQTLSDDIGHSMPLYPLDSSQGRATSGVASYHSHWKIHNVKRHAIISLVLNT